MRSSGLLLLALLVVTGLPAEAGPALRQPVSVAQLEQALNAQHRSDREMARLLAGFELTQRLSTEHFSRLNEALPGRRSREALLAVADLSAFLDLPPGDAPGGGPPDAAAQKLMLSRAMDYVAASVHRLPDFLVTRRLTRFEDLQVVRGVSDPVTVKTSPLRRLDRSSATVLFREGGEVVEPVKAGQPPMLAGLSDHGVFGVLLAVVATDVLKGRIGFDHWEAAPGVGRAAVFRFVVPESQSHYHVEFCCYNGRDGWLRRYEATPRYHGELALDAATGAILRLVVKTNLDPSPVLHIDVDSDKPLLRADIVVEYGPVAIGGRSYICPLRAISAQTSWTRGDKGPASPVIQVDSGHARETAPMPADGVEYSRVTALNHYDFEGHHLFRGDARILPEVTEATPDTPR